MFPGRFNICGSDESRATRICWPSTARGDPCPLCRSPEQTLQTIMIITELQKKKIISIGGITVVVGSRLASSIGRPDFGPRPSGFHRARLSADKQTARRINIWVPKFLFISFWWYSKRIYNFTRRLSTRSLTITMKNNYPTKQIAIRLVLFFNTNIILYFLNNFNITVLHP